MTSQCLCKGFADGDFRQHRRVYVLILFSFNKKSSLAFEPRSKRARGIDRALLPKILSS